VQHHQRQALLPRLADERLRRAREDLAQLEDEGGHVPIGEIADEAPLLSLVAQSQTRGEDELAALELTHELRGVAGVRPADLPVQGVRRRDDLRRTALQKAEREGPADGHAAVLR
jgi:hypothetical protein